MPKTIASPTYRVSAKETSLVLGSCGRRPMTTTSKSSTETVTMIVVHQTQVGTSTGWSFRKCRDGTRQGRHVTRASRRSLPPASADRRHRGPAREPGDRDDGAV